MPFASASRRVDLVKSPVASVVGSSWSYPASLGVLRASLVPRFAHSLQGMRLAEYAIEQLDSSISSEAWLCGEA